MVQLFATIYIVTEFEHSLFIIKDIGEESILTLNDFDVRRQNPLKHFERVQFLVAFRMLYEENIPIKRMIFHDFTNLNSKTLRELCRYV